MALKRILTCTLVLGVMAAVGCDEAADSGAADEGDSAVVEDAGTEDADAPDAESAEEAGQPKATPDPDLSTPGNDAAGAIACSEEVDDCGPGLVCCASLGAGTCAESCDGFKVVCDGPEDCSDGQECCSGLAVEQQCADSCGQGAAEQTPTPLCHTDSDCGGGEICEPGGIFTFWGFCG